jgi:ubiquinone/menaquinone biosynthesis C-methylase UbiE
MTLIQKNGLFNIDSLIDKVISSNNQKVADLGCGNFGYFVFPLAKKIGNHGKIYAVDVVKENLEAIKKAAKLEGLDQIETVWSDLEVYGGAEKIKDNSLDVVFLITILYQSKKYIDIIKEACRMLKPGGKMLIVDWKKGGETFKIQEVDKELLKKEIKNMNNSPLEIKEDFSAGEHHYGLLLSKK